MLKRAYFEIAVILHPLFNRIETWQKYLTYIVLYIGKVGFNIIDVSHVLMTSSTRYSLF